MNEGKETRISRFALFYIAIVLAFVAIGPAVYSSTWVSSSDFHSCIEIVGSFIALSAGITGVLYFFGLKNRYYLIVGLGFFIAGSEDLIHGILSWNRLFVGTGIDFTRFVPGTYVAGRTVLAIMIIAAPLLERFLKRTVNEKREAFVYSCAAAMLGGGATALAFMLPLPQFIYPENLISRPVDFISAVLFLIAFVIVLKRYRVEKDSFGSLVIRFASIS